MSKSSPIPREIALRAAWSRGLLTYKLHSAQNLIDEAVNKAAGKLYVVNVSRQFGKSYWLTVKSIMTAIQKPKAVIKVATAFLSDLEEFILPAFDKVLEDCPEDLKPRYKVQGSKFIFPNGSQIKLIGLDRKPNGLRGNTIDLILIDEAGFVKNLDYLYKSVIIPATMHRPDAKVIFTSTPPESPDHPFASFCERAKLEDCYAHYTIYDNPMVTLDIIEELAKESGGKDSVTFRREYLAETIVDSERAIIPEWKDEFIVDEIPASPYRQYYHNYSALDLGFKDMTASIHGHYDFQQATLYIEDEYGLNGYDLTTPRLVKDIKEIEERLWGDKQPYKRISDNNNLHLLNDMTSLHSFHWSPVGKESLHAMVNEVRMLVGEGRLKVHSRCKKLIACLQNGLWDNNREKFARSTNLSHVDWLAALVYLIRELDKHTNPIPRTHNTSKFSHYISPELNQSDHPLANLFKPRK